MILLSHFSIINFKFDLFLIQHMKTVRNCALIRKVIDFFRTFVLRCTIIFFQAKLLNCCEHFRQQETVNNDFHLGKNIFHVNKNIKFLSMKGNVIVLLIFLRH